MQCGRGSFSFGFSRTGCRMMNSSQCALLNADEHSNILTFSVTCALGSVFRIGYFREIVMCMLKGWQMQIGFVRRATMRRINVIPF